MCKALLPHCSTRPCCSLRLIVIVCAVLSITQWDHWSREVQQPGPAARLLVQVVMGSGSLLIRYGVWLSTLIRDSPGSPSPKATAANGMDYKARTEEKERNEGKMGDCVMMGVSRKNYWTVDQKLERFISENILIPLHTISNLKTIKVKSTWQTLIYSVIFSSIASQETSAGDWECVTAKRPWKPTEMLSPVDQNG